MKAMPYLRKLVKAVVIIVVLFIVVPLVVVTVISRSGPVPLTITHHPPGIYAAENRGILYSPFDLHIQPMERLLLVSFDQDPDEIYSGFEPQVFDDSIHGTGFLVIAWRNDGYVDVYHQPQLRLDPASYQITGKGLADLVERPLEGAFFTVTPQGVDASFDFEDKLGRPIAVTITEKNQRTRQPFGLLAPMGSAVEEPTSLPLVMLHDFYFVRRTGTEVSIKVAGSERQPGLLPLPIDFSRMYFLRYSPDPLIVTFNPEQDGPLQRLETVGNREARSGEIIYDLADHDGFLEILRMRRLHGPHAVTVTFSPPFPDLVSLAPAQTLSGLFSIEGHPSVGMITGEYRIVTGTDRIDLSLSPTGGWQPNETKLPVNLLYLVNADFKNWPKTYLWEAVIDLTDPATPNLRSAWRRL